MATIQEAVATEICDECYVLRLKPRPRWRRALRSPLHFYRLWRLGIGAWAAFQLAYITATFRWPETRRTEPTPEG